MQPCMQECAVAQRSMRDLQQIYAAFGIVLLTDMLCSMQLYTDEA